MTGPISSLPLAKGAAAAREPFAHNRSVMADKVRSFDWSKTPLGPLADWPVSLRTAVGIVLDSPEVRVLLWGAEMITIYNDAAFTILGDIGTSGLGQSYPQLRPEAWVRIQPYLIAARDGRPQLMTHMRQIRRPSGEEVEVPYSLSVTPVCGDTGTVDGILIDAGELAVDSPSRNQTILENMRFRQLFAQAPVFLAIGTAPDFRFESVNSSYQALVGNRPLVGRTVAEALPELAEQGFVQMLEQVVTTGEAIVARDCPIDLRRGDDETLTRCYVDFAYQPIKDGHGKTVGIFCVGSDVSAEHRAREEAERLQIELNHASRMSAMDTMAQTLAHELNQPLTAASNFLSGGLRLVNDMDCEPKPAVEEALRLAKRQIERASAIVRGARSIVQDANPRRETAPLGPIVAQAISLIHGGECHDVEFRIAPDLGDYWVTVNPTQIEQVLINLGRNACQAMMDRERQEVDISARDNGHGFVEVLVRDTGPGLPKGGEESVFSALAGSSTGLGVGLSLSRTLIEAHGGRLWGRNNADGCGATFGFTIPLARTGAQEGDAGPEDPGGTDADGSGGGT